MGTSGRALAGTSLAVAAALGLSGCQYAEDWAWLMMLVNPTSRDLTPGWVPFTVSSRSVETGEAVTFNVTDDQYPGIAFTWSEPGGRAPSPQAWDAFPSGQSYYLNRTDRSDYSMSFATAGDYEVYLFAYVPGFGAAPAPPTLGSWTTITVVDPEEEYTPPGPEAATRSGPTQRGRKGRNVKLNLRLAAGSGSVRDSSPGQMAVDQTMSFSGPGAGRIVGRERRGPERVLGQLLAGRWTATVHSFVDLQTGNGWLAGTALVERRIAGRKSAACISLAATITQMRVNGAQVRLVGAGGLAARTSLTGTLKASVPESGTSFSASGTVRIGTGKRRPIVASCGTAKAL